MHASHFDHLARSLARRTTRRRILSAASATAIASAVSWRQAPVTLAQCSWTGTYDAPLGGAITMNLQETGNQVEGGYVFSDGATSATGSISGVVRTDFAGYTVLDGYWQESTESGRIWFSMPLDSCAAFAGSFTGTQTSEEWTPGWDGVRAGPTVGNAAGEITLFSNPGDSRVAALTVDSHPTTLFGPKAIDGSLEHLAHVQMDAPNGDPLQQVLLDFDAAGVMTRAALGSGESMRFDVVDPTRVIITYQSADGSQEIQFPFDTMAAAATTVTDLTAQSMVTSAAGRLAFSASPDLANALTEDSSSLQAAQDSMGNRGLIEVRCATGQLINSYVSGWFTGANTQGQRVPLQFDSVSPGVSAYVVPVTKAPPLDAQAQTSRIKWALAAICTGSFGMLVTGTSAAAVCAALVEAPPAAAGCAALITAYRAMCGLNTAWNFGIGPVIDAFSDEVEVTAQVNHPTLGHKEVKVVAEAGESIPTGVIQIAGAAAISLITTTPVDPSPGEGYQVQVDTVCAPNGAQLTVSVAGTDSFATSTEATLSETVTGTTLSVPGGSQGIQDTITVQLSGGVSDTKTRAIVF